VSELTYTIIRLGLLALLWVFVLSLAAVLRRDLYGTRISRRGLRDRRATPPSPNRVPVPAGAAAAGAAAASPAPPKQPRRRREPVSLVVTDGQMTGTSLPLGRQGVLIGRGPECTLVLDDEFASSRHARIEPRRDGVWVEDIGSTNGTYVNGTRLGRAHKLVHGDVVRVGETDLRYEQ